MSPQNHDRGPAALDLRDNSIYLARDGVVRCRAKTEALFRSADRDAEAAHSRFTVSMARVMYATRSGKCTLRETSS